MFSSTSENLANSRSTRTPGSRASQFQNKDLLNTGTVFSPARSGRPRNLATTLSSAVRSGQRFSAQQSCRCRRSQLMQEGAAGRDDGIPRAAAPSLRLSFPCILHPTRSYPLLVCVGPQKHTAVPGCIVVYFTLPRLPLKFPPTEARWGG